MSHNKPIPKTEDDNDIDLDLTHIRTPNKPTERAAKRVKVAEPRDMATSKATPRKRTLPPPRSENDAILLRKH
ncbi:hypothetical protein N7467_007065 [Penicillium canescens]|nr:hypothetical protein N7467_007065 [Penicillium canescens]